MWLSEHVAAFETALEPEQAIQSSLGDLVEPVCRNLHVESQKHLPDIQALLNRIDAVHRQKVVGWLLQAFDAMQFHDSMLFAAVVLLDRYLAKAPGPIALAALQRVLMAAVCTVLKLSVVDEISQPLRAVISRLCRDQLQYREILWTELAVLQTLGFEVTAPTALDFLETLLTRQVRVDGNRSNEDMRVYQFAKFLLELSLFDVQLHYRYPHVILAAAAAYIGLWTMSAPATAYEALLEDLNLHSQEFAPPYRVLMQCVSALHITWCMYGATQDTEQDVCPHLKWKFSQSCRMEVARIEATAGPPPSPPCNNHSAGIKIASHASHAAITMVPTPMRAQASASSHQVQPQRILRRSETIHETTAGVRKQRRNRAQSWAGLRNAQQDNRVGRHIWGGDSSGSAA